MMMKVASSVFLGLWLVQLAVVESRIGRPDGVNRKLQPVELVNVGNNLGPGANLGHCEGDCDNDAECADGLICYQRTVGDSVPGCTGNLNTENDYCILTLDAQTASPSATDPIETMAPTTMPTMMESEVVTGLPDDDEEGDDEEPDDDEETSAPTDGTTSAPVAAVTSAPTTAPLPAVTAAPTLTATVPAETAVPETGAPTISMPETAAPTTATVETQQPSAAPLGGAAEITDAPTMAVTPVETEVETEVVTEEDTEEEDPEETFAPTEDLQIEDLTLPPNLPELTTSGNDGTFDVYPLTECSGDCDTDDDCEGDLVCFQRQMDEPVPGCSGDGDMSIDYCAQGKEAKLESSFLGPFSRR
ncbi:expressed unknown protein [Seminavis robusta]|uniref:Uncharacterized protein n=1 Tax=Seminavis robusta TaxID=568900 RepID=A0A9N8DRN6_9STRA|nr:expressed unknown protein [Seminavis robusta]|eukprot:Sro240_g096080.1 n/a (360) ;mRNA; r:18248-19690